MSFVRQASVGMQEQRLHRSDFRTCSDSCSCMSPVAAYQWSKGGVPRAMASCWKYTTERFLVIYRRRGRSCCSGTFVIYRYPCIARALRVKLIDCCVTSVGS